jgi:hypothetical protein
MPTEYPVVAARLADELLEDPDRPEPKEDLPHAIADLRAAALELAGLRPADPEVAALAAEAQAVHAGAAEHLERFLALPRPPGEVEMFLVGFFRGFNLDFSGFVDSMERAEGRQAALEAEVKGLIALTRRGEVAKLHLPRVAARHAGPAVAGIPVALDLDASWGPFGPDDRLTLVNRSGRELHNAMISVELRGRSGDPARNVHFVPRWPAGKALYAKCERGRELLGEVVRRMTVPGVESAVVSVWADELSREGINYTYAGPERDADVARYCQGMAILGSYRPYSSSLFWTTQRGVVLRLSGIRHLENPRVTVTFVRGGAELTVFEDYPLWEDGETKTLDAGGRLAWDPEEYRVAVTFPDTGHAYRAVWRVP